MEKYSWDPRRYVKERLDRAMGSRSWCTRFPSYKFINGDQRHSYHRPVMVVIGEQTKNASDLSLEPSFLGSKLNGSKRMNEETL